MTRLTEQLPGNRIYVALDGAIIHDEEGYKGEAVEKLAKFENFYNELAAGQDKISQELEKLRSEGKEKSVKFKELFTKKLMNNSILILLKSYGLE